MQNQFDHESHVNYNVGRMQNASDRNRQLRKATAHQPHLVAEWPAKIRLSIGAMLITAGQHIRHESSSHAEVSTGPVNVV
jgi:uncharacterized protein (DUF2345 family)